MLVSRLKPEEEILKNLNSDQNIFILSCKGCAEGCEAGGETGVKEMKPKLESAGKTITGYSVIDFLCEKALVKAKLSYWMEEIKNSDAILILGCGIGVQAVGKVVNKPCIPASNTISLGGRPGEWRSEERCGECGDCLLFYTGGICPVTACTKSLINGPCGGAKNGKCEFEPDVRDCGWCLIYERLKKLNRLNNLKLILTPKNYAKAQPPKDIRKTGIWALEQEVK